MCETVLADFMSSRRRGTPEASVPPSAGPHAVTGRLCHFSVCVGASMSDE